MVSLGKHWPDLNFISHIDLVMEVSERGAHCCRASQAAIDVEAIFSSTVAVETIKLVIGRFKVVPREDFQNHWS